jgi:hypothetical protein
LSEPLTDKSTGVFEMLLNVVKCQANLELKLGYHGSMPLLPTHKKKASIAEKKPKKILFT